MENLSDKEYNLLKRSINYIDFEDIVYLFKDHGFNRSIEFIEDSVKYVISKEKEKKQEYRNNYINNNIIKYKTNSLYQAANTRAKTKGINFNLTKEWIECKLKRKYCEITGIKFKMKYKLDEPNPYAPSIDQIDPSAGYTVDNCRIVIIAYNKFKSNYSDDDCFIISKALLGNIIDTV